MCAWRGAAHHLHPDRYGLPVGENQIQPAVTNPPKILAGCGDLSVDVTAFVPLAQVAFAIFHPIRAYRDFRKWLRGSQRRDENEKRTNPAKSGVKAYQPRRLGIATLVYIPVQEGYFDQSLEIFKIHLASVRQYTSEPFDYLVFDNGSCPEVKRELEKLHEQGLIESLVLSEHNLGKTGALNLILAGMPNEWICFTNSDMLFREGWLDVSWKINDSYPDCGMIGAQIIFPRFS